VASWLADISQLAIFLNATLACVSSSPSMCLPVVCLDVYLSCLCLDMLLSPGGPHGGQIDASLLSFEFCIVC
jgi:hypothetical protein